MQRSVAAASLNSRNDLVQVPRRHQHAQLPRHRAAAAAAAGGVGSADAGAAVAGSASRSAYSDLSMEELQRLLSCRKLSGTGCRAELEERLADFMRCPSRYPEADCAPKQVQLLGGRLFAGARQLRTHVQLLLQLLEGCEVEEGHADFAFLSAMLRQHPRYAEKVHPPLQAFRVEVAEQQDMQPIRYFQFRDSRGSWDDFSYRKCLGLDPALNHELTFRDAMRQAIQQQLVAYRTASATTSANGHPVFKCDVCGRRVENSGKLRLVHAEPTFGQLVSAFCSTTKLQRPPVDGKLPGSNRGCFTDPAWLAEWQRYHRRNVRRMELRCMRCVQERAAADKQQRAAAAAAAAEA